jgi:hypothetical protein
MESRLSLLPITQFPLRIEVARIYFLTAFEHFKICHWCFFRAEAPEFRSLDFLERVFITCYGQTTGWPL